MNACACIVGWHFPQEFFESIRSISGLEVFIISHQPRSTVPQWLFHTIPEKQVFFEKNSGYDWGAYQQFIDKRIWQNYDTIFFLHDDVLLKDKSLFINCEDLIHSKKGICIVGNGRVTSKRNWPLTHIHSYAHSKWKPPEWNFEHEVVRGSFWATSNISLERIGNLEIYWDRCGLLGIGAGNLSLRATCGKVQDTLGKDAMVFLSDIYRISPYLVELVRGEDIHDRPTTQLSMRISSKIIFYISKMLMTRYMNSGATQKQALAWAMEKIFVLV